MREKKTALLDVAEHMGITESEINTRTDAEIVIRLITEQGKKHAGGSSDKIYYDCDRNGLWLDADRDNRITWVKFVASVRLLMRERASMSPMGTALTLGDIEYRIRYHMEGAYRSILEVGRCLIQAKDSGLVPHGDWEHWVRRNTGMSERAAQNLMRAAREVAPGSALSELPISQINEILTLPEPQREAMAERAKYEDFTVKQLREAIKLERQRSDQMIEKYNNMSGVNSQLREKLRESVAEFERREAAAQADIEALRVQLDEAKRAGGISEEAQREIDRLRAELADAEEMAARQASMRQQAQQTIVEMRAREARGDTEVHEDMTAETAAAAVRTFIGTAGYLPHSSGILGLNERERQAVLGHVRTIEDWAKKMRDALRDERIVIVEEAGA